MKRFLQIIFSIILSTSIITSVYADDSNLSDRKIIKQIKKYNRKIKNNDQNAKFFIKRGYLKFCLKDYNSAIDDYTQAQALEPDNKDVYYLRGRAWFEKNNYKDSMDDFNKAIELDKKNSTLYISRGLVKDRIGEYESAINDFTLALKYDKKSKAAYINRGISNDKSGRPIAAIGDYQRAIKVSKGFAPDAYYNMALAKCKQKKYEDALEDLTTAIEQNPYYSNAYYNRGLVYLELDHLQLAKKDLEKAVQYDPQNTNARNELEELRKRLEKMLDTTLPDWMLETK